MASITKRNNGFSVVYRVNGKQIWESYKTNEEAQARKIEVEFKQSKGTFVPPMPKTIKEFLEEYVEYYGKSKWTYSTLAHYSGLIKNYIIPNIGTVKLKDCNTRRMDIFFDSLKTQNAVQMKGRKEISLITDRTIYDIHAILQSAFNLAVSWEYVGKSPITKNARPNVKRKKREIWTPEIAREALRLSDNFNLTVCMHLGLACSMRLGEILGLRWEHIDFGDIENSFQGAKLHVYSEIQRITNEAFKKLSSKKVHFIFPAVQKNNTTKLVLKEPKSESSVRDIWIPPTVSSILWQLKKEQEDLKERIGDAYSDFDMVIAQDNGRPIELRLIDKAFAKLIKNNNFPKVVFHSLRHLSTSLKLVYTNGDIKGVQNDNGHAQATMTLDVYGHGLDGNRAKNAEVFEENFYNNEKSPPTETMIDSLVKQCVNNPELISQLLHSLANQNKQNC